MTLASTPPIVTYLENGSTLPFAVPFQFIASTDLVVTRQDAAGARTLAVLGADYSVSGGAGGTGTVTMTAAKPTGWKLEIKRHTDRTQPLDLTPGDTFPAESIEAAFSRGVAISQEIEAKTDDTAGRALLVPIGEAAPPVASLAAAEGKVLAVVGGIVTPIANSTAAVAADVAAAHADRVAADADAAVAAAALAELGPLAGHLLLRRIAVLEDIARQTVPVLTTASLAYHAIYATFLVNPLYTGPLFRVLPNAGGAAVDIYPEGRTVSPGTIALLRGTGAEVGLRIDKWYDQSGNGRDMTQTVAARRPCLHEDAYWNGAPVILFDGGLNYIGGPDRAVTAQVGFDFTHNLTGQQCAMFAVADFKESTSTQFLFAYTGSSGGGTGGRAIFHNYSTNTAIISDTPAGRSKFKSKNFRAGMAVYGFREKAGPLDLFIDGVPTAAVDVADGVSPGASPTIETLTTGRLGYTPSVGYENYQPNFRLTAFVVLSGASPNNADCIALSDCLRSNCSIRSRFDSRVIVDGDSIIAGGANRLTLEQFWYLRQQSLNGIPEFYNLGIPGKTMIASYNDRLMFDDVLYKTGDPVVYVIQSGSNDINSGVTAATLHNSTLANYITFERSKGPNVKVVVCTILGRADYNAAKETQRLAYNALVRANSLGADAICDVDAALAAVNPLYWTDNTILGDTVGPLIHPTSATYKRLAPVYAAAFNAVRAAVVP